jgi:hypothetical protein
MRPRVKWGLIAGTVGLVFNVCVAMAFGVCGPIVALLGGAAAGFFAARDEKAAARRGGAALGAISGVIAGGLIFIGQMVGAVGALALIQITGTQTPFGHVPTASDNPAYQAMYYFSGLGTGVCMGLIGLALAAGAGAIAAYLATPVDMLIDLQGHER